MANGRTTNVKRRASVEANRLKRKVANLQDTRGRVGNEVLVTCGGMNLKSSTPLFGSPSLE